MKIFIIVSFIFQLTISSLYANGSYEQYISMKKKAYTLYETEKTKEAISVVSEFIGKHPKSLRAKNLLAVLYYWKGELSKSKDLLQSILNTEKFPQSLALLKQIEKKEPKLSTKPDTKVAKQNQASTADINYLLKKIKKDPSDVLSRKILAIHYTKIGDSKKALYYANLALKIDPDDSEMLALLPKTPTIYNTKQRSEKAIQKLEKFYDEHDYNRFMNLYSSLEHHNILMPTQTHVDALHCAIELSQYEKAKSILHIYRMPKSDYMTQIEKLLDDKLLIERFTVLED